LPGDILFPSDRTSCYNVLELQHSARGAWFLVVESFSGTSFVQQKARKIYAAARDFNNEVCHKLPKKESKSLRMSGLQYHRSLSKSQRNFLSLSP
jgi:hypothetical protein